MGGADSEGQSSKIHEVQKVEVSVPQGFTNRRCPQCSYCNDLGHVRETCWKLNEYPKKKGYHPKAKAGAVQLVHGPDFYGVAGQDHRTTGGATLQPL